MNLQELSDRLEINDLLTRYARAVDRKEWDLYRDVFTPDAEIDYTSAGGINGDTETQAAWLAEALAQFPATQHMVANVDITFTGDDSATVEAMFHNPMVMPDKSAWVTGGWYHHEVRRTADGWRSVKLREESAYFSGMPSNLDRPEWRPDMSVEDRVGRDKARIEEWMRYAATSGETPAIDAATVVVLRDGDAGLETLMLRRNSKIAFGGMWVFPGGRVDEADRVAATDPLEAARIAAAREAEEEAALTIPSGELVMFAHWIPPPIAPRRYATWFFAAGVSDRDHTIDDGEIVDSDWMTPDECLGRHHEGEIELAPPTWVTLHTMRGHDRVNTALSWLASRPARHHATRIGRSDAGPVAMWAGDAGYELTDPALDGPRHRLEMFAAGYRYDDSGISE